MSPELNLCNCSNETGCDDRSSKRSDAILNGSRKLGMVAMAALLAVFLSACSSPSCGVKPAASTAKKILFIGDSFTFFNEGVYTHVQRLAASARHPRTIVVDSETQGGATLKILQGKKSVHDKIRNGHFDVVVMQDDLPEYTGHNVTPFMVNGALFEKEVRQSGATPVIFMAWPYERLNWITLDEIIRAHKDFSAEHSVSVAPVGLAFQRALADRPKLAMLGPDKEHETIQGTYLAANIIYATLFGESPIGCTYYPKGVSAEEADFLQHVAWETVLAWQGR